MHRYSGDTEISFTLTFTLIKSYSNFLEYSVKLTGNLYNNQTNTPFSFVATTRFNPFSEYFGFYLDQDAEIEIEYFKAEE